MSKNTLGAYFPDESSKHAFLESAIKSCNDVIEHYTFVINDISSDISNPELQNNKEPALTFLKAMRTEWENSREKIQQRLNDLK